MWSSLESSHGLIHVAADWRARLGQHFAAFNANFLQRTPHLATSYPCPRGCGCMHRVAQRSPSSFTASCRCNPSAGPDLVLTPDDVALFELSWPRLARALCSALGLNPKPARFILPNTCQIGAWSPAAVPAILTIQSDPARFRNKISGLAAKLRQPFIFLAPTSNHLDVRALEPLHQARAGFFDLASHITMTPNGSLHSKETPGRLFARFTPQPEFTGESVARHALAMIEALERNAPINPPSVMAVFRLYCIDELTADQIARKCHCSKTTVIARLNLIRQATGADPKNLRRLATVI